MTTTEYLDALSRLKMQHSSQHTGVVLGVTPRTLIRYATGKLPVPPTVAHLVLALRALTADRRRRFLARFVVPTKA